MRQSFEPCSISERDILADLIQLQQKVAEVFVCCFARFYECNECIESPNF